MKRSATIYFKSLTWTCYHCRDYILDGTVLSLILSGDLSLVGLQDGLTPALPHQVDHLLILVELEPEFDL